MENNKKPKKSEFISKQIKPLNKMEMIYLHRLNQVINNKSEKESIAYTPSEVSEDGKIRQLIISKKIIDKIQSDHGKICAENMIINAHEWDYCVLNVDEKPDRINLVKIIPNSNNYLIIAADKSNGFFAVTHFETESKNGNNLKRLLKRGNVLNRVSSVA
jgi:CRISPR/Cas system-associated protein endoribonuclease Cas2